MEGGIIIFYQLNNKNVLIFVGALFLFLLLYTQPIQAATNTELTNQEITPETDLEIKIEESSETTELDNQKVVETETNVDLTEDSMIDENLDNTKSSKASEDENAKVDENVELLSEEQNVDKLEEIVDRKVEESTDSTDVSETSQDVATSRNITLSTSKVETTKVVEVSSFTGSQSYLTTQKDKVNVYASQSTSAQTLGYLKPNVEYQLKRIVNANWIELNFVGLKGYILQSDARPSDGKKVERKNPGLNVLWEERSNIPVKIVNNPDNPTVELGQINPNTTYKVVGTAGTKYVAIDVGNRLGYVSREQFTNATKYLLPAYEATVQGYQDGKFQTLGTVTGNAEYKLHRLVGNDWVTFNYNGVEGYIKKKDARPSDGTKMERKNTGLKTLWKEYANKALTIVDNPDNPSKVLGTINTNTLYKVVGTAGVNYVAVDIGNRLGYISRERFTNATKYLLPAYETRVQGYQDGKFQTLGTIAGNQEYKLHRIIGKEWVTFNYGGVEGYINQKDVRPSDGTKMERRNPGLKTLWKEHANKSLAIVDNPDNPSEVLGTINANTLYKVVGTAGVNYYAIDLGNRLGYVSREQFTNATKYFLPAYTTPVYENINGKYVQVGEINENAEYQLTQVINKDWVVFNFGGKKGYIKQKDARPGNGKLFGNKNPNLPVLHKGKAESLLTIYLSPSMKSNIIGHLNKGEIFSVVGTAGPELMAIDVGGRFGYVPIKSYLNINKQLSTVKKIVIDPGHGGKFTGARGNGLAEETMNLDLAKRVEYYLNTLYSGHSTYLTRTSNVHLAEVRKDDLIKRAEIANNLGADVFVSIHLNAGGGAGYEDYRHEDKLNGVVLQNIMHKHIAPVYTSSGIDDRGKKSADFSVLRNTTMPAILTENGYMDNSRDMAKMKQEWFRNQVAKAHADGIAEFLGLRRK